MIGINRKDIQAILKAGAKAIRLEYIFGRSLIVCKLLF